MYFGWNLVKWFKDINFIFKNLKVYCRQVIFAINYFKHDMPRRSYLTGNITLPSFILKPLFILKLKLQIKIYGNWHYESMNV